LFNDTSKYSGSNIEANCNGPISVDILKYAYIIYIKESRENPVRNASYKAKI
jgi:hypothetical protein